MVEAHATLGDTRPHRRIGVIEVIEVTEPHGMGREEFSTGKGTALRRITIGRATTTDRIIRSLIKRSGPRQDIKSPKTIEGGVTDQRRSALSPE
jgi:hypothetical protein